MKEQINLSTYSDLRIGQTIIAFTEWFKQNKVKDLFYIDDAEFYECYSEWLDSIETNDN